MATISLTSREIGTILAALRLWQTDDAFEMIEGGQLAALGEIAGEDALNNDEIDALAEAINMPEPPTPALVVVEVSGGVVQSVTCDGPAPASVLLVDYDTDDAAEDFTPAGAVLRDGRQVPASVTYWSPQNMEYPPCRPGDLDPVATVLRHQDVVEGRVGGTQREET